MKTMRALATIILGILTPLLAAAGSVTVGFSGTSDYVRDGSQFPGPGSAVTGSLVFDFPNALPPITFDSAVPNHVGYETLGDHYRLSVQLGPSFSIDSGPLGGIGVEVIDNGSDLLGIPAGTDVLWFGIKRQNVVYSLWFEGPANSFSGTAFPSPETLARSWTSVRLHVHDYNVDPNAAFRAQITDISVSAVPEPESWVLLLAGAGLLCAHGVRRTRGRHCA